MATKTFNLEIAIYNFSELRSVWKFAKDRGCKTFSLVMPGTSFVECSDGEDCWGSRFECSSVGYKWVASKTDNEKISFVPTFPAFFTATK